MNKFKNSLEFLLVYQLPTLTFKSVYFTTSRKQYRQTAMFKLSVVDSNNSVSSPHHVTNNTLQWWEFEDGSLIQIPYAIVGFFALTLVPIFCVFQWKQPPSAFKSEHKKKSTWKEASCFFFFQLVWNAKNELFNRSIICINAENLIYSESSICCKQLSWYESDRKWICFLFCFRCSLRGRVQVATLVSPSPCSSPSLHTTFS